MKYDLIQRFNNVLKVYFKFAFWINLLGLFFIIYDFGFNQSYFTQNIINQFFYFVVGFGIIATILRYFQKEKRLTLKVISFDLVSISISIFIIYHQLNTTSFIHQALFFHKINWVEFAVFLTLIRELAEQKINYKRISFNPAQLFIISFIIIILLCTLLLLLPNSTVHGINLLDALFTATSAVCVTGLAVVDTSSEFTTLGQIILVIFIQIGGLGILTFASYFSYFFKGSTSYGNQLVMSDMSNAEKIGEVFSTFKRVLTITFIVELFGAILLYFSTNEKLFESKFQHYFFSMFHSISAFCNAGFSTLSNSIVETGFTTNYFLQLSIITLFVLGGLGFPIVLNLLSYLKHLILKYLLMRKKYSHKARIINLNSKITLITTFSLIGLGTLFYFILEYNNTLQNHSTFFGKIITALFQATTPRTAGFNAVDMGQLHTGTILLTIFLMWIGASPSSTGGGIKTSTFAIATLNFLSLAKGKNKLELSRREIPDTSIRRAFAIITLSFIVVGIATFTIALFNPELSLLKITFECFSAYSTTGLSLGITNSLHPLSKFVLILTMFTGRVTMLTVLIAFMKKVNYRNYKYPTEDILIN